MFKLSKYLNNYKRYIILGPTFKLLEAIFELIVPLVMASIIDEGINQNNPEYVYKMGVLLIVFGVLGLIFALTCQYFASVCGSGFGTQLREALYRHINSLSLKDVGKFGTPSLITRLCNDTYQVQTGVNMFIRLAIRAPILIVGAIIMAISIDVELSLIFLIATPFIAFVIYFITTKTVPLYGKLQKKLDSLTLLTKENIDGTRVVRAFAKQKSVNATFENSSIELEKQAVLVGKLSALLNPIISMAINVAIALVLWFGGVKTNSGILTQGEITALVNYMTQILLALIALALLVNIFTKAIASAKRVNEVFDTQPSIVNGANLFHEHTAEGEPIISAQNASFDYNDNGEPELCDISFTLDRGQTLGIIGPTGSGKTTLINLLTRQFDTVSGKIIINGKDIKSYNLKSLRSRISVVPQKVMVFSGTILDNLRWGKQDLTEEEAVKALKIAQAWDFVSKLPNGIHTKISQSGKNLSGGQKQRITIARAIAINPQILIFDDSSSALDYATDLALRKAIKQELAGTTVIIISQRATSIQHSDKILVLHDGLMVGIGTHEELSNSCDVYRDILAIQQQTNS